MKKVRRFNNKKVSVDGIVFDSKTEAEFYKYLCDSDQVASFTSQVCYMVLDDYKARCVRCSGDGKVMNEQTERMNQCTLCKGEGYRKKRGITYTADFVVEWADGKTDVIDVKGGPTTPTFNLKRKLFEALFGI